MAAYVNRSCMPVRFNLPGILFNQRRLVRGAQRETPCRHALGGRRRLEGKLTRNAKRRCVQRLGSRRQRDRGDLCRVRPRKSEAALKVPVRERFDLVEGTRAGSILAGAAWMND